MTKIHDQIRRLLNLAADDAASEGEIANALKFASNLMARHQIDESECTGDLADERAAMTAAHAYGGTSKAAVWEGSLAMFVADFCGCGVYRDHPAPKRTPAGILIGGDSRHFARHRFYGLADSVEMAIGTYQELRETVAAMAKLRYGGVYRGPGRNYCEGFAAGLRSQIKKAVESDPDSQALAIRAGAIVRQNQADAKNWLATSEGIHLQTRSVSRRGTTHDHGAYGQGQSDGARASVGGTRTPRIGSGARRQLT